MTLSIFAGKTVAGGVFCLLLTAGAAGFPAQEERGRRVIEVTVTAEHLDVFDQPDEKGYIIGQMAENGHLRVRSEDTPGTGWLAVEPLPTSILWVEETSLELEDKAAEDLPETARADGGARSRTSRAWTKTRAVVRVGHPLAKLPGPPRGTLPPGTLVRLVDRPPLKLGRGSSSTRWLAIVPPPDQVFFVRSDGIRWPEPSRRTTTAGPAEVRASFEQATSNSKVEAAGGKNQPGPPSGVPKELSVEMDRLDGMFQAIVASQPIARWRFDSVRAGYQNLLRRSGDRAELEEALRARLARVTQHERAAKAAQTIESILAKSRRRDAEVAAVRRDLARFERSRARSYDAVGFIQPSARMVDGHKVFALIGREGKTDAYLDIPPGLDPNPFLAGRVGVRGQARFNEDLGTRLITVRDLENIEKKR